MTDKLTRRQALKLGGGALAGAVALGSATSMAESAAAAPGWIRLPIITANIGRNNLGAREAAIRDVRNGDAERPFVGWQEISEGDEGEPAMISQYFGANYNNVFLNNVSSFRVPISVPAPWVVVNAVNTFVHDSVPPWSPPRWINEVAVQHPTGAKFVLINTHYIYNAYNGDQRADLRPYWDWHKQVHRQRVINYHNNGTPVIWTADTNNPNYDFATGLGAESRAFADGVDRIDWLPGNGSVQLNLLGTKVIPMNVDGHNARVAILRIRVAP
jgi:hypothetical protein